MRHLMCKHGRKNTARLRAAILRSSYAITDTPSATCAGSAAGDDGLCMHAQHPVG